MITKAGSRICIIAPLNMRIYQPSRFRTAIKCCSNITLRAFSNQSMQSSINFKSSRDSLSKSRSKAEGSSAIDALRKTVIEEVAIPGKYRTYFKPDKRAIRKAEESMHTDRARPPKKVAAAKWKNMEEANNNKTEIDSEESEHSSNSRPQSRERGFENVGWRALEHIYARDVLPHPLLHRDYLQITEIKLLPDRKTFQLWYTPKPDDKVSSDQIAEAVAQHAGAFKAMLARYARSSTSSRLTFQLVRQSDQRASMADIWKRLEDELHQENKPSEDRPRTG